MADIVQHFYQTAAAWTAANPELALRQFGWESDTGKVKVGDGVTLWNALPYYSISAGVFDVESNINDTLNYTATNPPVGSKDFTATPGDEKFSTVETILISTTGTAAGLISALVPGGFLLIQDAANKSIFACYYIFSAADNTTHYSVTVRPIFGTLNTQAGGYQVQAYTVSAIAPVSSGGEINTASNVGTGDGQLFKDKVVADLRFRRLIAGTNVTISTGTDDVTINASGGGGGEANTASNVGTGTGVWKDKVGVDLRFKSLVAGTNITFDTTDPDEIELNASGGGGVTAIATVATSGATQTVDFNTNRLYKITLSADCTITLTNGASATDYLEGVVEITNDTTPRTVTFAGTFTTPGGITVGIAAGSGDVTTVHWYWNGTTFRLKNLTSDQA